MFEDLKQAALRIVEQASIEVAGCGELETLTIALQPDHLEAGQAARCLVEQANTKAKGRRTLYAFRLGNAEAASSIQATFAAERARISKPPKDNRNLSRTVYVGSSRSIGTRLKDHLGIGSQHTYGLKLGAWFPKDQPLELHLAFCPDDTSATTVAALEDALWQRERPMVGRRA